MSAQEFSNNSSSDYSGLMLSFTGSLKENALYIRFLKFIKNNYVSVIIVEYIKKSHQNDPYRTLVEAIVVVIGVYYIIRNSKKNNNTQTRKVIDTLSQKEFDSLLHEWEPKPLVDPLDGKDELFGWKLNKQPIVTDFKGDRVDIVTNSDPTTKKTDLYNLSHYNFLKLLKHPKYSEKLTALANKIIKNCGVGSCGPAGFYGNEDLHYRLEYDLAAFLGTDSCVLYGQDFATIPSVLSTFNKRGDIIVADKLCNVAIQNALQLSRATVYYYDHNDMEDLERYLEMVYNEEKNEGVLHRRYIVTEGIFQHNGQICKLDSLLELKEKYKFRLFIDETLSIGALGEHGKGVTEHFGYPDRSRIDITVGSLGNSLSTGGGFVVGDATMSFFQRIGSNAYCFSASLPPYCCGVVSEVLDILSQDKSAVTKLHANMSSFNTLFAEKLKKAKSHFIVTSHPDSPMIVLKMSDKFRFKLFQSNVSTIYESINRQQTKQHKSLIVHEPFLMEEKFIQEQIIDKLVDLKILIGLQPYSLQHESLPLLPGILLSVDTLMETDDIEYITDKVCEVLSAASRN